MKLYNEIWSDPELQPFKRAKKGNGGKTESNSIDEVNKRLQTYGVVEEPKTELEAQYENIEAQRNALLKAAVRVLEKSGMMPGGAPTVLKTPRSADGKSEEEILADLDRTIRDFEEKRVKIKETLEKYGFKVEDMYMKREEVEQLLQRAKTEALDDALEDKRLEAVGNIINNAVSKLVDQVFAPVVHAYFAAPAMMQQVGQQVQQVQQNEGGGS